MRQESGSYPITFADECEVLGERIQLPDDVIEKLLMRDHSLAYAAVQSVSLAAFVRGVRQI